MPAIETLAQYFNVLPATGMPSPLVYSASASWFMATLKNAFMLIDSSPRL